MLVKHSNRFNLKKVVTYLRMVSPVIRTEASDHNIKQITVKNSRPTHLVAVDSVLIMVPLKEEHQTSIQVPVAILALLLEMEEVFQAMVSIRSIIRPRRKNLIPMHTINARDLK